VEVASPSTVEADLDLHRGKGWSYAQAGVAEYLVLDPSGELIPELGRGWRLKLGAYRAWRPDEAGRWQSAMIAAAIGVDDGLAAVYDRSGHRVPREGEVLATHDNGRRLGRDEGLAQGLAKGRIEGKRETVQQLARMKFGPVAALEARIATASEAELDVVFVRVATAESAEEV
jgi:hypothetical protein